MPAMTGSEHEPRPRISMIKAAKRQFLRAGFGVLLVLCSFSGMTGSAFTMCVPCLVRVVVQCASSTGRVRSILVGCDDNATFRSDLHKPDTVGYLSDIEPRIGSMHSVSQP